MNKLLMSIRTEYALKILDGTKKVEFRTRKCGRRVESIIIYATSPTCAVVGEAIVEDIVVDSPERIWARMSTVAGIEKSDFDLYFKGKAKAVAYILGEIKKYEAPLSLFEVGVKFAPQSFVYI